ncbi:hypothetical protein THRCLA_10027 [Thraustotheca clavata]|uniref:Uncharacterized protein n=1 Tax=Thraustotheca clavata TaxID=74557 RepID=A0A1V9YTM5_9STRA|nr:hypothetical protein THRCLA_10027 [Thraustotheca clavata]
MAKRSWRNGPLMAEEMVLENDGSKRRKEDSNEPQLVPKESLILGVGVGFFVRESLRPGDIVAISEESPSNVDGLTASKLDTIGLNLPPQVEIRESLIAGVGFGLFACSDLQSGDIIKVPNVKEPNQSIQVDSIADTTKDKQKTTLEEKEPQEEQHQQRNLFTLDDVEQREKYGIPLITIKESLISGVGFGAFASEDFEPGDVLGALDEPASPTEDIITAEQQSNSWDEQSNAPEYPFADIFSQEALPSDVPVLGDWSHANSLQEMQSQLHTMSLEESVPPSGWLKIRKNMLLLLLQNMPDDAVLRIPTSFNSLAERLDR